MIQRTAFVLLGVLWMPVFHAGILDCTIAGVGSASTFLRIKRLWKVKNLDMKLNTSAARTLGRNNPQLVEYVDRCLEQMPDIDDAWRRNLLVRDDGGECVEVSIDGCNLVSPVNILRVSGFSVPQGWCIDDCGSVNIKRLNNHTEKFRDSVQYMILAHELGHRYYQDEECHVLTSWGVENAIGAASYVALRWLTTLCQDNSFVQWSLSVCGLGVTACIQHYLLPRILSNFEVSALQRHRERRADMFALKQARCKQDIERYKKFLKQIPDCPEITSHPLTSERVAYIAEYQEREDVKQLPDTVH